MLTCNADAKKALQLTVAIVAPLEVMVRTQDVVLGFRILTSFASLKDLCGQ